MAPGIDHCQVGEHLFFQPDVYRQQDSTFEGGARGRGDDGFLFFCSGRFSRCGRRGENQVLELRIEGEGVFPLGGSRIKGEGLDAVSMEHVTGLCAGDGRDRLKVACSSRTQEAPPAKFPAAGVNSADVAFMLEKQYVPGQGRMVGDGDICPLLDGPLLCGSPFAGEAAKILFAGLLSPGAAAKPEVLVSGADFYSNARINSSGTKLTWLQWNHPLMPWDGCELWVADFGKEGIQNSRLLAGGNTEAVFQPEWHPKDEDALFYVSDRTGWWNLHSIDTGTENGCTINTSRSRMFSSN